MVFKGLDCHCHSRISVQHFQFLLLLIYILKINLYLGNVSLVICTKQLIVMNGDGLANFSSHLR